MRRHPWLAILALGLATTVDAQTPPHAECRIVSTVVTCTNVAPVSEAAATAILNAAIAPYSPDVPRPFATPSGWTDIGPIQGKVFGDLWPFESAGTYCACSRPAGWRRSPRGLYADIRQAYDPLTHRWYR